ncbi:MAG: DNA polymerase III subunit gamma/tau [Candidatus Scalindua arabica]|uniref:DNA polymerase III subunit gamma/tau n=1 Tax=Candidatus Scalindua arabica TaxID=1127984 RepID=A0A941W1Q3_9BACT|nr:DNA polymerase III subunit gamma/tau [Candidatus Scalindua arabica]
MAFSDILAQDHITDHFRKTITSNHLSHAYIFTGQDGIGKTLLAKEFSKAIFCSEKEGDSCNLCNNCVRIENSNHPDIHWIEIEEKAKFLKIDSIRDLQQSVTLCPVESNYKLFIIKDTDRMNEEASNCLLKTLEEPPASTIIILIANSLTLVKETIKSRCQIIRFHPIPAHVIEDQLIKRFDADAGKVGWVSRFSSGSLGSAFELLEDNYYEKNRDIVNRIGVSGIDNLLLAEEVIDSYLGSSETLEEKRQALRRILNCILQFYRDVLVVKVRNVYGTGKKASPLFNEDHKDALQRCAGNLTQRQITAIINDILESIKYIDYNLNINLLVENIFTRIAMLNSSERE